MPSFLSDVIIVLWVAWAAYWAVSLANVKATARRTSGLSQFAYSAPLWLVAWLLIGRRFPIGVLNEPFMPAGPVGALAGVLLIAVGLGFAVWARRHLGGNWSATVTVKADHELVTSGPYALVRHPIYTGLLVALLGTAIANGEWRGLVAVAIAAAAFAYKLSLEERWMVETFGSEYRDYRKKVAALIPFLL